MDIFVLPQPNHVAMEVYEEVFSLNVNKGIPKEVVWCSPTSPFFKLSTDDSSFSNPGPLGFGGCGVINMEKIYTNKLFSKLYISEYYSKLTWAMDSRFLQIL